MTMSREVIFSVWGSRRKLLCTALSQQHWKSKWHKLLKNASPNAPFGFVDLGTFKIIVRVSVLFFRYCCTCTTCLPEEFAWNTQPIDQHRQEEPLCFHSRSLIVPKLLPQLMVSIPSQCLDKAKSYVRESWNLRIWKRSSCQGVAMSWTRWIEWNISAL